jgi:hypothetical protein
MTEQGPKPDLVVFSSAGRAAYLSRITSAVSAVRSKGVVRNSILSVDGIGEEPNRIVTLLPSFDQVVLSTDCRGYISNIVQALHQVRSESFFWLEDDWDLPEDVPISEMSKALDQNPGIAQVRIPRFGKLLLEDRRQGLVSDGIYAQGTTYSLNPHLARTEFVRSVIASISAGEFEGKNIEWAFSYELRRQGLVGGVVDPGWCRVDHLGTRTQGYDTHQIPAAHLLENVVRQVKPLSPEHNAEIDQSRRGASPWIAPIVRGAKAIGGALFALGIGVLAIPGVMISRQMRSFVRTVWAYWFDDGRHPWRQGPSRLDPPAGQQE